VTTPFYLPESLADDQAAPTGAPDFIVGEVAPIGTEPPTTHDEVIPDEPNSDEPKHPPVVIVGVAVVVVIMIVILVVVGLLTPSRQTPTEPACPSDTLCVTADKVLQDYSSDSAAAEATYQGKYLAVSGRLTDAFLNSTGRYTSILKAGKTGGSTVRKYIGCRDLPYNDIQTWESLHPNKWQVTMYGTVVAGKVGPDGAVTVALMGCRLKLS